MVPKFFSVHIRHCQSLYVQVQPNIAWRALDGMNETKQIAMERVHILFRLAKEAIHEEPRLAQNYVQIARRIAMRTRLRLPVEYRRLICRHCKSFIYPGANCRVRIKQRREPHVVITCLNCGKHMRIPLSKKEDKKR
jgi:ribonuclease P protein subunit RPR2